ncbi:GNAT family protein [Rhizobium sp. BK251]|uniref:GNAT family N-acetyltransferase n=1 Tax=Rhizobium sp. BK251 TaxID=2512125 RepID=UPI0032AE91FF
MRYPPAFPADALASWHSGNGYRSGTSRQGLGHRLIVRTLEGAREKGVIRVELSVHSDNERAIRLYERVGFVREGVARDAVFIDGRYLDAVDMALIYR